jgi:hypothetical protein
VTGPRNVVVAVGKALAKAVVAGLGLELARIASRAMRARLGLHDDDDDGKKKRSRSDDDVEALRRENALLREELQALRQKHGEKAHPSNP